MHYLTLLLILASALLAAALSASEGPGEKVQTVTIKQGDLEAAFRDNSLSPAQLSGIISLVNTKSAPGFNAFDPAGGGAAAGMNFEHIISGHASEHNAFSPRKGPYALYKLPGGKSVIWKRESKDDPWGMESSTRLTVTAPHYLDLEFRCRATDASKFGARGWAIMFWCNYMNDVAEVPLQFLGIESEGGAEKWIKGDGPPGPKDWNTGGTYRSAKAVDPGYDAGHNFTLNNWSYDYPRYTRPFYYGLAEHGMVYMLMFDKACTPTDEIRFSIFKFKLKTHPRPAWDYEYVIHKVETGKQYGYRARVVYKKFVSAEDCLKEYQDWASSL